ncbi:hypothetical protein Ancab_028664 [Ancistrocladus abbreviatus]
MGGVCSSGAMKRSSSELKAKKFRTVRSVGKRKKQASPDYHHSKSPEKFDSGENRLSFSCPLTPLTPRYSGDPKKGSFLGRAGIAGLERAVEVIDALSSSVTSFHSGGFTSGMTTKGNKISVLAFEVANTIMKAANLVQSLSEENVHFVKQEVLQSEGVHKLVATDMKVLLSIAAADKRVELDVFCREVIRFGDLCKDPQWHNLDRFFAKLDSESAAQKLVRVDAELKMRELVIWAQYTSELYHELNALDRFELDYQQKLEEVKSLNLSPKGESIVMLHTELRQQKKLVWSLRKKSLWSKKLEEVIEKLVDVVAFIHHKISEAFEHCDMTQALQEYDKSSERLGPAGLALHYANMINQIDNIALRPTCLPPNVRDSLYQGLPTSVKAALRFSLRRCNNKEETTAPQIKAEMKKTLQWLVPMAANTTKMHQGFGWVGEWANASTEFSKKTAPFDDLIRLQTLYHADKKKADSYILELVTWLHQLIIAVKQKEYGFRSAPFRSPSHRGKMLHSTMGKPSSVHAGRETNKVVLSKEEQNLLERVTRRGRTPGISKSQEFVRSQWRDIESCVSSRSMGRSPFRNLSRKDYLDIVDGLNMPL